MTATCSKNNIFDSFCMNITEMMLFNAGSSFLMQQIVQICGLWYVSVCFMIRRICGAFLSLSQRHKTYFSSITTVNRKWFLVDDKCVCVCVLLQFATLFAMEMRDQTMVLTTYFILGYKWRLNFIILKCSACVMQPPLKFAWTVFKWH